MEVRAILTGINAWVDNIEHRLYRFETHPILKATNDNGGIVPPWIQNSDTTRLAPSERTNACEWPGDCQTPPPWTDVPSPDDPWIP